MAIQELSDVAPAAIGALGGSAGVLAITRFLLVRTLQQYDRRLEIVESTIKKVDVLESTSKKIDVLESSVRATNDSLHEADKQVAVLIALSAESKNMRIEIERSISELRGESKAAAQAVWDQIDGILRDLYVAHERIRLIGKDADLQSIQRPEKIRRR